MLTAALALAPLLARFIPDIVGWLGGDDAEQVAGRVVNAVTAVAGTTDPAVVAAVISDPDRGADLALGLARIAADREKAKDDAQTTRLLAAMADTEKARQFGATLVQSGSKLAWAPVVISVMVLAGFFSVVLAIFVINKQWDERSVSMVNGLFGTLTAAFGAVIQYWLGTARDSVGKDERQQQAVAMATDTARRAIDSAPAAAAAAASVATAAAVETVRPLFQRGEQRP